MSVSHIWVCDELRQYIDPYPLDCPHLYVWAQCDLVESAAGNYVHGWSGKPVRLVNDSGDQNEYYLRTSTTEEDARAWSGTMADTYRDVTADAKAQAALWFPGRWWEQR